MAAEMSRHTVDLVLAAEPLPRDGTIELVAAVRSRPDSSSIPVLALAEDEVVQPIGSGDPLTARLVRPVHWSQVSEAISDLIRLGESGGLLSEAG